MSRRLRPNPSKNSFQEFLRHAELGRRSLDQPADGEWVIGKGCQSAGEGRNVGVEPAGACHGPRAAVSMSAGVPERGASSCSPMYILRPPTEEERARAQAFLPAPPGAKYLLAVARTEPSPERIVGAAAWWFPAAEASGTERAAFCRGQVLPRWEAAGEPLPGALLDALSAEAARAGASGLRTADLVPAASPTAALLAARGWEATERNEFFEGDLEGVGKRLDAAYRRLTDTPEGRAAAGQVRAGTLTPDLFPAIQTLLDSSGLVSPDALERGLRRLDEPDGYSRLASSVLLTTGPTPALVAVLLVRLDAATAKFDVRMARPGGCVAAGIGVPLANLRLLHASLQRLRAAGAGGRIRFRAHPRDHRETANFARRCGAQLVETACLWRGPAFQSLSDGGFKNSRA